ncbi:hypothetical protein FRC10_009543 [Ceratobasidium sp. 414]|nr:hypothetical protein FRC10_009543 [Ceratobasidium sp. 414]
MKLLNRMPMRSLKRYTYERDEFIGSSLTSSRLVSERILAWSGSKSRGRLFVMKLHSQWRHNSCPVMRWYEQQRESSTRFQVIEHRKNLDGPFYHEFLLLKLADGAVCRVERTGDGSRADALRFAGCTSNDLIQWFSADDYTQFSNTMPSNLIAEVDLQQEFDILDILAVCYSIQKTKACRVYTLQRYNCYFFCWTILAVLTRRLWETTIASDAWDLAVNSAMDHWSNVPLEEAKKHIILRIYALLDPNNPSATLQFLDPLRSHLCSNKLDLSGVSQALDMTLWATTYESALREGLAPAASDVQDALYADGGVCGTHLQRAIAGGPEERFREISSDRRLEEVYWDNVIETYFRVFRRVSRAFSHQCQLMEIERPLPFIKLAQCNFLASVGSFVILFGGIPRGQHWDVKRDKVLARNTLAGKLCCMRMVAFENRLKRLGSLAGDDRYEVAFERELSMIGAQQGEQCLTAIYDAMEVRYTLDPSKAAIVHSTMCDDEDFNGYISSFATSALAPTLPGLLKSDRAQLHAKIVHSDKQHPTDTPYTVEEFQKNYLRPFMHAHAKRVAAHQLAAAELVEADIQGVMAEVWKSMPDEFRGSKTQGS